jgi:hypothetical protein
VRRQIIGEPREPSLPVDTSRARCARASRAGGVSTYALLRIA